MYVLFMFIVVISISSTSLLFGEGSKIIFHQASYLQRTFVDIRDGSEKAYTTPKEYSHNYIKYYS